MPQPPSAPHTPAATGLRWIERGADLQGQAPGAVGLRKYGLAEKVEAVPDSRRIKFVISTNAVDRDNDTIDQTGWDLTNFQRNPVVLWAHSHADLPIARCVQVALEDGQLVAVAEFATHAFAETVYQMLKGGFLRATSVGFRALEWVRNEQRQGIDFKKQELLEFSVCPVPANQEALMAASASGVNLEPLRKWVEDIVMAWPGELRLKGRAWDKITGDEPRPIGEANVALHVDTAEALTQLRTVEAEVDRIIGKASLLDRRASALAKGRSVAKAPAPTTPAAEPLRWNRSLSKSFDVAAQEFPPQSQEQALAAAYLESPIRRLHHGSVRVRSARMGAFLVALDAFLADDAVQVDDLRNLDYRGHEAPPVFEDIRLNSKRTQNFLVDGMRFLRWNDARVCLRVEPRWYGLEVTHYAVREQQGAGQALVERVQAAAKALNFLKGEAFTLGGEFLDRGTATLDDVVLDAKNTAAAKRLLALVNGKGAAMESRGALLVGPPGTGKTLLGRILMAQAQATFVWISSRDFAYAGSGYSGMSDAFEIARECAPTVLFIEDVDNWLDGHTVDLMKTEMDGIAQHAGVLTMLTTNYPELLPKALIDRPGRFHDVLRFDLPDAAARAKMLNGWLPGLPAPDVARAVEATAGMSGAHMRELARFAGILAEQDGLGKSEALAAALAKVQEQRDLITAVQAQGSRYRAPAEIATKALKDVMPGEEAAELVGYQALDALLAQLASQHAAAASAVAALIEAEQVADDGSTPPDEEAEEAVEGARLATLLAYVEQMRGTLCGLQSLAASLCADNDEGDEPMPDMALGAKGVSPKDVSTALADADEAWAAPTLADFTAQGWTDLTDAERRAIAGHYAWAAEMPPAAFGDLKLGHHDPKTHKVVWRGVVAATGRLGQPDIPPADLGAVKAHLRRHYRAFGQETPDALKATPEETAKAATEKRGRVLSRANENKLKAAVEHATNCQAVIQDVLAAVRDAAPDAGDETDDDKGFVLELADLPAVVERVPVLDAEPVLEIDDDEGTFEVDEAELRALLGEAVRETVGAVSESVRVHVQRTLNQMRGRVD